MNIRHATPKEAKGIATHLMLAMEDIVYVFIGEQNYDKAFSFLQHFAQLPANQYSYENCLVVEEQGEVVAVVNVYYGGQLSKLRLPIKTYIEEQYSVPFNPEDETSQGEWYIDTLGVHPNQQGKGVGSLLLNYLIEERVTKLQQTLGLLVDLDNPNAKRLYLKLGFKSVGEKTLAGKQMDHLQLRPL